jgi:agmatinase
MAQAPSRAAERVFHASMQVDLLDTETGDAWKKGIYMRQPDKKILMKSDYLRKEAELYINYTSKGECWKRTASCASR